MGDDLLTGSWSIVACALGGLHTSVFCPQRGTVSRSARGGDVRDPSSPRHD